jgi:hypothetical protein
MNIGQKILTVIFMVLFLLLSMMCMSEQYDAFQKTFVSWVCLGVVYIGLFFVFKTRQKAERTVLPVPPSGHPESKPSATSKKSMADETTTRRPPPVPRSTPRTAPAAKWSLGLAVLSFFCGWFWIMFGIASYFRLAVLLFFYGWLFTVVLAVVCGHTARREIRKSEGALGGKGIATAGLILGYIALVKGVMGISLLWQVHSEVNAVRQRTVSSYGKVPSFELVNQIGQPFGSAQLVGQIWIADFIYTTAPQPTETRHLQTPAGKMSNCGSPRATSFFL